MWKSNYADPRMRFISVFLTGRGFDIDAAIEGRGLGLTSIEERVRLLNGTS
jgi:hypothetical protein